MMSRLARRSVFLAVCTVCFAVFASSAWAVLPAHFSWSNTPQTPPTGVGYDDAAFTTPLDGWVITEDAAYHSQDGGSTWTTGVVPTARITGIEFGDAQSGWITGDSTLVLHTDNNGTTWTPQLLPDSGALGPACALDAMHVWIPVVGGSGQVDYTVDGGSTWYGGNTTTGHSTQAVDFSDTMHGWAVGVSGAIARSTDGGQSWTSITTSRTVGFKAVAARGTQEAWIGGGGILMHTIDSGASWETTSLGGLWITDIQFVDPLNGWLCGTGAVYRTSDAGSTWQLVTTAESRTINRVAFPPGSTAVAYFPGWERILKYTLPTYSITPLAVTHGTITPNTAQTVAEGSDSPTFTLTPESGYRLDALFIDGSAEAPVSSYAFHSVTTSHTISARFALNKATVRISRTPAASSKTYRRKKGVARFTLSARMIGPAPNVGSQTMTLQYSTNGGKTWKTHANLKSGVTGVASHTIAAKRRGTTYYRWKTADSAVHSAALSTKFKAVVK